MYTYNSISYTRTPLRYSLISSEVSILFLVLKTLPNILSEIISKGNVDNEFLFKNLGFNLRWAHFPKTVHIFLNKKPNIFQCLAHSIAEESTQILDTNDSQFSLLHVQFAMFTNC